MKRIIVLSIMGAILFTGMVYGEEYNLSPSAAAIISPGNNPDPSIGQRLLIKFDLPNNISVKLVGRAYITFTFNFPEPENSRPVEFKIFPLTASWDPQNVGWDTWENDGGDFDKTKGYSFVFEPGTNTDFHIDVTDQVQYMANGDITNYGFILIPVDFGGRAYRSINPEYFNISNLVRLELKYR